MRKRAFYSGAIGAAILWTICTLCFTAPSSHALMTRATIAELTAGATGIIRGHVLDVTSRWDLERKTIFTHVTVSVDEWLKGSGPEVVTIRIAGGEVDGMGLWVEDTPVFVDGQTVVTFLEPSEEESVMQVKGLFQGKFTVKNGRVVEIGLPLGDFVKMVDSIVKMQEEETGER